MRRRRSVCLFLKCAPEGVLSTLEIFQNTSGYQESLRQFDQGEVSWLPLLVWESQPKSTFSFPHWEWRTGKKRLKMRDLGSKPKLRDIVRSYHFSFLWALCMIPLQPEYFLDIRFIYRWEYCLTVGYILKAGTVWSCWVYVPPESMERTFNKRLKKKSWKKKVEGLLLWPQKARKKEKTKRSEKTNKPHTKFERVSHDASQKIIPRNKFWCSHKESWEAEHALLFSYHTCSVWRRCETVPSGTHSMSVLITSRTTDFVPKCSYWEFYHSLKLQRDWIWLEALWCSF